MKELSTKEKAEAYNDALEIATNIYKSKYKPEKAAIVAEILEAIFPELVESEDEKIRKVIYGWIYTQPSQFFDKGFSKEDMLTWLEKQGEQKPTIIIPKFRIGDEIKTDNEEPLTITKIDNSGYWSEDLFICSFEDSTKWELVGKSVDKVEPIFKLS